MISLIGLPGSGKSTVGRQLARRLQLPFLDSDHVIEERIGCAIRDYFERHLHARGHVVYLRSSPEELFRRLRHDTSRPLLQVADPLGRLRDLYTQRDPLYRETAHFVIETGRPSVATLVNMIAMQLELAGIVPGS